ncbi:MAG: hypothetical protein WCV70_04850, partial [Patescibacteria group bacterium]
IPVDEPGHIGIIRGGVFEPFKEEKIVYQPVKAQKAIVVKSEQENNIEELKKMAAQYPPDSFEHKVIEEEIEKTKHE